MWNPFGKSRYSSLVRPVLCRRPVPERGPATPEAERLGRSEGRGSRGDEKVNSTSVLSTIRPECELDLGGVHGLQPLCPLLGAPPISSLWEF